MTREQAIKEMRKMFRDFLESLPAESVSPTPEGDE